MSRKERAERREELLNELQLGHLRNQKALTLSGGERRRLEITRALATNPSFIMLDEPFGGVDPINVFEVQKIVANLRDRGLGVLITDHNVRETLAIVDRAYLICNGEILFTGDSEALINDEKARQVYLGQALILEERGKHRATRRHNQRRFIMEVIISAKQYEINEALKAQAEELAAKLAESYKTKNHFNSFYVLGGANWQIADTLERQE